MHPRSNPVECPTQTTNIFHENNPGSNPVGTMTKTKKNTKINYKSKSLNNPRSNTVGTATKHKT